MAKVVCNSSPIIGLSMIGKLNLLWEIFDEVFIPEAVYKEVTDGNTFRSFGEKELKKAVQKGHLQIYKINNKAFVEQMIGRLNRGELEVMVAAKELGINRVIIDDRPARNFAETMLLKSIGLVGILTAAKELGKITEVKNHLDILIQENYRISKKLYLEILKLSGEEKTLEND